MNVAVNKTSVFHDRAREQEKKIRYLSQEVDWDAVYATHLLIHQSKESLFSRASPSNL